MYRYVLAGGIVLAGCTTTPTYPVWKQCLQCPTVSMYDFWEGPADSRDLLSLDQAKKTCNKRYRKSPCLVSFTRWEPGRYSATCGKKTLQQCKVSYYENND